MPDQYSVTTHQNYFQRLGGSLFGALIGLFLIVASSVLLFWNEGRAVDASRGLDAGARAVVSLTQPAVMPGNEGRLIHASGPVTTTAPLTDADTGAVFPAAAVLIRTVETYQWVESRMTQTRDRIGGGQDTTTTYGYAPEWKADLQDSSTFAQPAGHANPPMPFKSRRISAVDARMGDFTLPEGVLDRLNSDDLEAPATTPDGWRINGHQIYRGAGSPDQPQVGDVRVSYAVIPSGAPISVVGRQSGRTLSGWTRPGSDYPVLLATRGVVAAQAMVQAEKAQEGVLTWILRGLGLLMSIGGFALLLNPLKALGNIIPFVASLIGAATGLIAFALGSVLSLCTVALAWLAVRPILSGLLLAGAVGLFFAARWAASRFRPAR